MIHLNVDKILEDLKNGCCEIKNISEDILFHTASKLTENGYIIKDNNGKDKDFLIKFNFPSEYKINDNEYIIKIYINNINNTDYNTNGHPFVPESYRKSLKKIFIIYITNYGRIIKSQDLRITPTIHKHKYGFDNNETTFVYVDIKGLVLIDNNILNNIHVGYSCDGYYSDRPYGSLPRQVIHGAHNIYKIELIEQPKLLYRIPRLFIDVIDAFHTQNTDLMQECCKTYLEISRESKVKESIMKDIKIKEIKDEKDMIIKEKENIIAKKDKEIEDLKIKLEIFQQKYDKIKKMFN